jgi:hypothetical protein
MSLPNRPRFVRSGQTLDLTWPAELAVTGTRAVGGGEVSAAGVPAVYVVRHEPIMRLTLRVTESEFVLLDTFWRATQGAAFTFRGDQTVATDYSVYWDAPGVVGGEELTFERDSGDPSILRVSVALRRTTSTAFTVPTVLV